MDLPSSVYLLVSIFQEGAIHVWHLPKTPKQIKSPSIPYHNNEIHLLILRSIIAAVPQQVDKTRKSHPSQISEVCLESGAGI